MQQSSESVTYPCFNTASRVFIIAFLMKEYSVELDACCWVAQLCQMHANILWESDVAMPLVLLEKA